MTQIIEAENSPLIQVPQTHSKIKTKRFIKTICRHAAVMANAIEAKLFLQ
jgi:hypothetical protein